MTARAKWIGALVLCGLFTATDATAADNVHVEFWTMSLRPKFTAYFKQLVKTYESSHPNVELEWVDVPWDTLQTKLTAAIVAGSAPALVQLNVPWAYDYALYGALRPIDDLLGDDRENYTEGSIADLTFKGKVYGFPHYNSVNVMAYNRTLFKEAGITRIPATRDEQLDAAKKIKARSGQYGFSPALGKIAGVFLEEGLPLVRAANTGISAVIDPLGHVVRSLPLGSEGVLDASLPQPLAPTVYARIGDGIAALLVGVAFFLVIRRRYRARPTTVKR